MITTSDDLLILQRAIHILKAERQVTRSYICYYKGFSLLNDFDADSRRIDEAMDHVTKDWSDSI